MKIAAVHALAELAKEPVPDSVLRAYDLDRLQFGPEYLIPKPFDPRVLWRVAPAVAKAAMEEGLARAPIDDFDEYVSQLQTRFNASHGLINAITTRAMEQPKKIVYPHAEDVRMIRAARRVTDEGIGNVVLLGDAGRINGMAEEAGISIDGIEVIDYLREEGERDRYALTLEQLRRHKGLSLQDARRQTEDPAMYACLMVREGAADAVIGGLSSYYPETIRPALQVLQVEEGRSIVSSVYLVVVQGDCLLLHGLCGQYRADRRAAGRDRTRCNHDRRRGLRPEPACCLHQLLRLRVGRWQRAGPGAECGGAVPLGPTGHPRRRRDAGGHRGDT